MMKRRVFVSALATAPAALPPLLAQRPQPAPEPAPKIDTTVPDAVAAPARRFFSPTQYATLEKLGDTLMPSLNGTAGSREAGAPEFLDFLIGRSDASRKKVYTAGLDALQAQSQKQFGKPFPELDPTQIEILLAPLHQPWTYAGPADPLARFLHQAKLDIRTATTNSREYSSGRRFGATGIYWYPLD